MENEIRFYADYKGVIFNLSYGSEAYILQAGIYNEIDTKYGICELMNFVNLVRDCYIKDDRPTPIGALSDYIAENWEQVREMERSAILEKFYDML